MHNRVCFIFGVNWLWHWGVTALFRVFFMKQDVCNWMTSFMEFMQWLQWSFVYIPGDKQNTEQTWASRENLRHPAGDTRGFPCGYYGNQRSLCLFLRSSNHMTITWQSSDSIVLMDTWLHVQPQAMKKKASSRSLEVEVDRRERQWLPCQHKQPPLTPAGWQTITPTPSSHCLLIRPNKGLLRSTLPIRSTNQTTLPVTDYWRWSG